MTDASDASDARVVFELALVEGLIRLEPGQFDKNIFVLFDSDAGKSRLTYVTLDDRRVTAFVELVLVEPLNGVPCFKIGYAVPPDYRNQGRAKKLVTAAIQELKNGMALNGIVRFCISAVIAADNKASQRVAARTLSETPVPVTDECSGSEALQYVRQIASC